jgi:hypothetical protein
MPHGKFCGYLALLKTTNSDGFTGSRANLSLREELEIGNAVESLVVVLGHRVSVPVSQGQVKAACGPVGRWRVGVDPTPTLLSHELLGVSDERRCGPPAFEIRVHREPVQLALAVPLSKLDADEAAEEALRPLWRSALLGTI